MSTVSHIRYAQVALKNFILVGLGAALGGMARYGIGLIWSGQGIWSSTLFVNLAGSFLLGVVAGFWGAKEPARLLIGVGVLGGFTTYSTYSLEMMEMIKDGKVANALASGAIQAVGSVFACMVGFALATRLKG